MRSTFFGPEASTSWQSSILQNSVRDFTHYGVDIRDETAIDKVFARYGKNIAVVIHCAAQPSHDWAAKAPVIDFTVNANGTLVLLEATRKHCSDAVFIFMSTNKVYGDRPNHLALIELETRFELAPDHVWAEHGFDETMSIDGTLHSLFGASKVAADVMTQEYGRYFGMKTACFRGGCLTGSGHSPTQSHGFLAYLVKCAVTDAPYTVFGYKGKQVRDNIHSRDLVEAFWCFFQRPAGGEAFNIGGSRHSNCSIFEAITITETLTGRPMRHSYTETNRVGDHMWWVSDVRKFRTLYPEWSYKYDTRAIMEDLHAGLSDRLVTGRAAR
jgi:CDP-paratose 2-epimerase